MDFKDRLNSIRDMAASLMRECDDALEDYETGSAHPAPEPPPEPPLPTKQEVRGGMKLALIVGHTQKAPGADGVDSNGVLEPEYNFNTMLALHAASQFQTDKRVDVEVFFRDNIGITGAYRAADAWGADAVIELHYNAAANAAARGCETLYYHTSKQGNALAAAVHSRMVAAIGTKDRGLLPRTRSDRGGGNLAAGRAPACLVEPAFGSNALDARLLVERWQDLATAYVEGALDWWDRRD